MLLPLIFKADGMRCLIIGGGKIASRKVQMLAEMRCRITVIAPQIDSEIQRAVQDCVAHWTEREYRKGDCAGFQLVIAATDQREVNRAAFQEAKELGIPINVVDDPELCTVMFPAIWQEGHMTVAVSSGGAAPFMASEVRNRLAEAAAPMARWVDVAGQFRSVVRREVSDWDEKNRLYRSFCDAIRLAQPVEPPSSARLSDWLLWLKRMRGSNEIEPQ